MFVRGKLSLEITSKRVFQFHADWYIKWSLVTEFGHKLNTSDFLTILYLIFMMTFVKLLALKTKEILRQPHFGVFERGEC